jgi:hypothetical protein
MQRMADSDLAPPSQTARDAQSQPTSPVAGTRTPTAVAVPVTDFRIGEEFGTAKRNLPPAGIVLGSIAAVVVILGIYALVEKPKPQGAGEINSVAAAEAPGQNTTLVAITLTLQNKTQRSLWIKGLKAKLTDADGKTFEDGAASAVDFDRYYQGFPALKEGSEPPLTPEMKLPPGTGRRGTIIVAFAVTKNTFDQRKALAVEIEPYDESVTIVVK